MKHLFLTFYFLLSLTAVRATDFPFRANEELTLDIYYKYGLVMLRAGSANLKVAENNYQDKNSYLMTLDFKTTSFFDKIFKMRDTLRSTVTENLEPIHHLRYIHEGNYHFTDDMFFKKFGTAYTEASVKRQSQQLVRFDTILAANTMCYDMLTVMPYIISFDYSQQAVAQEKTASIFIGRDKIDITIRNEGQSVVEKSDTLKYKTYKIALDFVDSHFNESKNAVEIWLSDDQNRIPIKIRAKLRIGAVEVYLTSWKNLKYPLSSEIRIPVK